MAAKRRHPNDDNKQFRSRSTLYIHTFFFSFFFFLCVQFMSCLFLATRAREETQRYGFIDLLVLLLVPLLLFLIAQPRIYLFLIID